MWGKAEQGMDGRLAQIIAAAFVLTQPLWMIGAYLNMNLDSDELVMVRHFFNWTPKVIVAVIILAVTLLLINRVTDGQLLNKILESPDACSRVAGALLITVGLILCLS